METTNVELQAFATPRQAEDAIRALSRYGFDIKHLSLVRKAGGEEDPALGSYALGVCPAGWDTRDLWGTVWGLVTAPVVFFLPGLGLVASAGPVVAALMGAHQTVELDGAGPVLGAALAQLGMARQQVAGCEAALQANKFVLLMHGTKSEVIHAQQLVAVAHPGERPSLPLPSLSERFS